MKDEESTTIDPSFYRTLAHSYRNTAFAMLRVFGKDESINTIKLIRPSDLTSEIQNSNDTLLLPFPFYYNLSHGLELSMKGYLLLKGKTIDDVKKLNHNLKKIRIECETMGFTFNSDDIKCINELDILNKFDFALRYPKSMAYSLPDYRFVIDLINRFIQQLPIAPPLS